jgi:lysine-N-methylase
MGLPIQHLPVLQNWDCHVCGTCCKEYQVGLTEEERRRIQAQGWDREEDLGGYEPFVRRGPFWRRRLILNHRADGSCVFLSEQGRCRIHERHGYEAKPLACRLYPFVLVPVGDHWAVSVRFACPSAAANKGRPLPGHNEALGVFAQQLAEREGLTPRPDGSLTPPPPLQPGQRMDWPDVQRCVDALLATLLERRDPLERRLRKALVLAGEMRRARLDDVRGKRLTELLTLLRTAADADTPANLMALARPGWVGRLLFRQAVALYTRKDHGPNRGEAARGRMGLLAAAWRFARGRGRVPRMHLAIPETTFAQVEAPRGPLPAEAEAVLERYYHLKVGALQFCGPASFGLPLWEGFESLALTFPVILWVARAFADRPRAEAVVQALSVVDDHVGFNRILASTRQRLSFRILARTGELSRLIAWYSR